MEGKKDASYLPPPTLLNFEAGEHMQVLDACSVPVGALLVIRIILSYLCESLGYTHCLLCPISMTNCSNPILFIIQPAYFYAFRFQVCLVLTFQVCLVLV